MMCELVYNFHGRLSFSFHCSIIFSVLLEDQFLENLGQSGYLMVSQLLGFTVLFHSINNSCRVQYALLSFSKHTLHKYN